MSYTWDPQDCGWATAAFRDTICGVSHLCQDIACTPLPTSQLSLQVLEGKAHAASRPCTMSCLCLCVCMSACVCTWAKRKRKEEHGNKMKLHSYRNQHHYSPIGNFPSTQQGDFWKSPTNSESPQEMPHVWKARCVWKEWGQLGTHTLLRALSTRIVQAKHWCF